MYLYREYFLRPNHIYFMRTWTLSEARYPEARERHGHQPRESAF